MKAILFWDLIDLNFEPEEKKSLPTSFTLEYWGETLQLFVTTKEEKDGWISEINKYKKIMCDKESKGSISFFFSFQKGRKFNNLCRRTIENKNFLNAYKVEIKWGCWNRYKS